MHVYAMQECILSSVSTSNISWQPTTTFQWPQSQELIAKNLPDFEWKFKHPILNQTKRHLLTTDGSVFVNAKNLVAVPNRVSPERVREIANSLDHRSNKEVFLEAVVLVHLVENEASNGSLARAPQTSSLDNDDVKGTDGGAEKHGTIFLDPEPQAIDVWPKKLQPFDGNGQELNPLDDRTRDLGPLESKTQVDLESSTDLEVPQESECVHLEAHGGTEISNSKFTNQTNVAEENSQYNDRDASPASVASYYARKLLHSFSMFAVDNGKIVLGKEATPTCITS
ncbi:hypothetical protein Nepgr_008942 [Nepenthes gracilis]|uniref:Uncharacterized protein n=1 Tax=Nepenthes gracilis TaxID=150966 RepID=A0AAD3S9V5_NEPGR|nr:hypothetical protein Nepgr_008942 [Nepenthes gracilis]